MDDMSPGRGEQQRLREHRRIEARSKPFWELKAHRAPPRPPPHVSTLRMEQMLAEARDRGGESSAHFDEVLERYRGHPGVQRRRASRLEQQAMLAEVGRGERSAGMGRGPEVVDVST